MTTKKKSNKKGPLYNAAVHANKSKSWFEQTVFIPVDDPEKFYAKKPLKPMDVSGLTALLNRLFPDKK